MNAIKYSPKAVRQLKKIQREDALKIRDACRTLAEMPEVRHVKALVNHEYQYRFRVGGYRVFFDFDGAVKIVYIEEVKKRDENTY